jgi:hypothetical protein
MLLPAERALLPPLPPGEGWGEGELGESFAVNDVVRNSPAP